MVTFFFCFVFLRFFFGFLNRRSLVCVGGCVGNIMIELFYNLFFIYLFIMVHVQNWSELYGNVDFGDESILRRKRCS